MNWTAKEVRQFEAAIKDYNAEMKYLKQAIPTKSVAEIVRHFYGWKTYVFFLLFVRPATGSGLLIRYFCLFSFFFSFFFLLFFLLLTHNSKKLRETRQAELAAQGKTKGKLKGPDSPPRGGRLASTTRAVSPTLSVYAAGSSTPANTSCVVCSTTTSAFWYKGPYSWQNRALCVNCGLHWRKYAAESSHTDLLSQKKQQGAHRLVVGL